MKAHELMSTPVVAVLPSTPLKEVAGILRDRQIGAVPVVDEQRRLLGLVSETDLLALETIGDMRHQATPEVIPEDAPDTAAEVMSKNVVCVNADTDASEVARLLTNRRLRHVPVIQDGKVAGMISRRDLLGMLARSDEDIERDVRALLEEELGRQCPEVRVEEGRLLVELTADSPLFPLVEVLATSIPGIIAVHAAEPSK